MTKKTSHPSKFDPKTNTKSKLPTFLKAILFFLVITRISAQQSWQDTMLVRAMDEIVMTATRTERQLGNTAVPMLTVQQKNIQLTGNIRLNEVLQEQTGLFLTSGTGSSAVGGGVFGNGIQIQGLSPDYTLLLIDGEPLIGRQGGVMDLSRFTVGNIRKIEVVKGPSSALYGSEAMAGVVNIITEQKRTEFFNGGLRYGSFATRDAYASANFNSARSTLYLFGNYNASSGYDLNKKTIEKTIDPYYNATAQLKWTWRFSEKTRLILNHRFFYGHQQSEFAINSESINISGAGKTTDININPTLIHLWNDNLKTSLRLYTSLYRYDQNLDNLRSAERYYEDNFAHNFYRIEKQTDWTSGLHTLTTGAGYNVQTVETMRYRERKSQHIGYVFVQDEWKPSEKWTLIPGLRYDANSDYADRFSPKMAVLYKPGNDWSFNFSYGSGFKAPDFRQLYLYYVNVAAQGYRVYGASEFSVSELEQQLKDGLIARILPEAYRISELRPEISHGFNLGLKHNFKSIPVHAEMNVFYNLVEDLINYLPVAIQQNGTLIFSYMNVRKAYTRGFELNIQGRLGKYWDYGLGYQYLETGDREIASSIKAGEVYGRNAPLGSTRLMTMSDYGGLLGRSPHMANARLMYNHIPSGWGGSLRAVYRSSWGVNDLDGNGFANMKEEFAQGFVMLNASIQKNFADKYTIQLTANNILNHRDEINVPQMPGTHFSCAFQWNFLTP